MLFIEILKKVRMKLNQTHKKFSQLKFNIKYAN